MNLIIGGAYQGKLDYAKETYGFRESDIFHCRGCEIDFSKPCIDELQEFILACIHEEEDPIVYFKHHWEDWRQSTVICDDMSSGVVPLGADMRQWRQVTGQMCQYLSREASSVTRIFCGLEQKLK